MNSRLIKAYVEMIKSQNQNTPLIKNKNPITLSHKAKKCLVNPNPNNTPLQK